MPELDVFEARLARAVDAFADRARTTVDPAAVTREAMGRDRPRPVATMPRLAPAWMLLLAVALLVVTLAASLLLGSRPRDVVTGPGDVLATTLAGPGPAPATCPYGSHPDAPGPAAQARPPATAVTAPYTALDSAMAFDRHAGRIVLLADTPVDGSRTWTFDVCDNTWQRMAPPEEPPAGQAWLAYDIDSDRTVALVGDGVGGRLEVWTYAVAADRWVQGGEPPSEWHTSLLGGRNGTLTAAIGLVYHDPSGLLVFQDATDLWAYDLESDSWTEVRQRPDQSSPPEAGLPAGVAILAYDSLRGVFVAYVSRRVPDDVAVPETWTFDPRNGTWRQESSATTPTIRCGWAFAPECGAVFDPSAREIDFFAGHGQQIEVFDIDGGWHSGYLAADFGQDGAAGFCDDDTAVYDSINHRVVCRTGGNGVAYLHHTDWPTVDWDRSHWYPLLEPLAPASPSP